MGTIVISGTFIPALDPNIVAHMQVGAPKWHANLDHCRRQCLQRILPSGGEVHITKSKVDPNGSKNSGATKESTIHNTAPIGGGDDIMRTSIANTEGHAAIQSSSTDPTGKVSPSKGDMTGNACSSATATGNGIEFGAITGGTKVDAKIGGTKGSVTGTTKVGAEITGMKMTKAIVKGGMGEKKISLSEKVLMTLKTVAIETIILSNGNSSNTDDEEKDSTPIPPI